MAKHITRTLGVYAVRAYELKLDEQSNPVKEDLCDLEVYDFSMDDTKARVEVREALGIARLTATTIIDWAYIRAEKYSMTLAEFMEHATVVASTETEEN